MIDKNSIRYSDPVSLKICIVGPMLGRNPGWVTTQGEILSDLFSKAGYKVLETSSIVNRIGRLIDIVFSLLKWRNEFDVAIINVFSGPAFYIVDISSYIVKKLNKPIIFILRGGNLPEFSKSNKKWVSKVFRRAHTIVSPSSYLAKYCATLGMKTIIIPNIIEINNYPFRLRKNIKPNLLWMRTFHEIYNPEMAVLVVEKLKKLIPAIHLTMAGQEKGRLNFIRDLVEQKGLNDEISIQGFLNTSSKKIIFDQHDIYLNTNRIDNTPVSVIEAAAFGLPIIATRVGGIPDLLQENETGLIVDSDDVDGMAKAVVKLINDPLLVENLSHNGREFAEKCSWQNVIKMWQNVFVELQK